MLVILQRMLYYAPMMHCPMPAVPAVPIPIRPSLSFTATHPLAQHIAVQDTVQTPRKKTQTYRAPLPIRTITAGVHMVFLCARQHPCPLPRFRRLPSLLESAIALLFPHTFHSSPWVLHMQGLRSQCHLRGLRSRRPVHGPPRLVRASLARLLTTHMPWLECRPVVFPFLLRTRKSIAVDAGNLPRHCVYEPAHAHAPVPALVRMTGCPVGRMSADVAV